MFPPRYYLAGQDSTHLLTFNDLTPDVSSVTYNVRDISGTALVTAASPPSPLTATEVPIVIASTHNTKTANVETRFVDYNYTIASIPYTGRYIYKLIDYLYFDVTNDDVRKKLGLTKQELPDADIDLVDSYFQLDGNFSASLATLLTGTYANASAANQCILLTEAVRLIPSCPTRMAKTQTSGSESYSRGKVDWDLLESKLRMDLCDAMLYLQPLAPDLTLFIRSTGTDPVYGS